MVKGRSKRVVGGYQRESCAPCMDNRHDRCQNKIIGTKNKTCYCALQGHGIDFS